jgi:ABC-2 type transport system ATP-binding protein
MTALEARNLSITYRRGLRGLEHRAVDGLSLQVRPGEVVGFIGPNGAGKSSTIKALMGFIRPTSGEVSLLGRPAGSPAARREVGFLPEVAHYYPWFTPRETLWLYGRLAGLDAETVRRQTAELLERVGLPGRENDRLGGFSKGMLQRVGIAQALLGRPRLLILDEVSSGLDPLGRRDLRELLLDQKRRGTTIFFSSHELTEVTQVCDRVVLVQHGRVLDDRPVDTLLRELRRYWLRFRCDGEPPFPALRRDGTWEAEFAGLDEWRRAMEAVASQGGRVLDGGEREGMLEQYFVGMVS